MHGNTGSKQSVPAAKGAQTLDTKKPRVSHPPPVHGIRHQQQDAALLRLGHVINILPMLAA